MRWGSTFERYKPTPVEQAELEYLFRGLASEKATWDNCPVLLSRVGGDSAKLEQAVAAAAAFGRSYVLDLASLKPDRVPYYAPQYLAALGEVFGFTDEAQWLRQCARVMDDVEKFKKAIATGRYRQNRLRLLKRAAIWCGKTSEGFTRDHEDRMFQALIFWLDGIHPVGPPPEPALPAWLKVAATVALWAGVALLIYATDVPPGMIITF